MDLTKKVQDSVENTQEQNEKKRELIGSIRPRKGHTLFQYNTITGELTKATFEKQDATYTKSPQPKKRIVIAQEGFIYVSALNLKNAIKKLANHHGINIKIK